MMGYFIPGKGRRDKVEQYEGLAHFLRQLPCGFQPRLEVSFVEFAEGNRCRDSRYLCFTTRAYNRDARKWLNTHRVSIPFGVIPQFLVCVRQFQEHRPEGGSRQFGMLQEAASTSTRIGINADADGDLILQKQVRREHGWENSDTVPVLKDWMPQFVNLMKNFCERKMVLIKRSCDRRKENRERWAMTPPR